MLHAQGPRRGHHEDSLVPVIVHEVTATSAEITVFPRAVGSTTRVFLFLAASEMARWYCLSSTVLS